MWPGSGLQGYQAIHDKTSHNNIRYSEVTYDLERFIDVHSLQIVNQVPKMVVEYFEHFCLFFFRLISIFVTKDYSCFRNKTIYLS